MTSPELILEEQNGKGNESLLGRKPCVLKKIATEEFLGSSLSFVPGLSVAILATG